MRSHSIRAAAVLLLVVTACGSPTAGTTTEASTTTVPGSTTTTEVTTTTTTAMPTTTVPASTTTPPAPGTTLFPGTPVDFGPREGDVLMVMGVRHDDVLNLRAAPGASQTIVDTIEPTFMELVAQGETREIPGAFWIEVDHDGEVGWVNMRYIGYAGGVDDITASVVDDIGGPVSAASMIELGLLVAESIASDDPASVIVRVTPVTTGDLHEVSYDVVGFGDDAVAGARLHVFGQPTGSGFALKSVESMVICSRGVDGEACV
jgi:hypothetical protein